MCSAARGVNVAVVVAGIAAAGTISAQVAVSHHSTSHARLATRPRYEFCRADPAERARDTTSA